MSFPDLSRFPLPRALRQFALSPTDLLRDGTYRRLWTSILISSVGAQVTLLALPLTAAVMLHASPNQMGVLTATELAPYVIFGLPAGVWLDRVHKLPVYVVGQVAMALTVTTVPLAWWTGHLSVTWLCVVAFVIGSINTVAGSAAQIVLTQVVPRARLVEAHAKNALANSAAEVMGPSAAGALIRAVGAPVALLADATFLIVSTFILRGVAVTETLATVHAEFVGAMRDGIRFVRGNALLVGMAGCVGTWQLCNQAATVVHILFATRELGLSARGVGLCYLALGVGTISTSAFGPWVARRVGSGPMLVLGFLVCGSGWLILSLAPLNGWGVACYALMLLFFGVGAVFIFINFLSLRQAVTPAPLLGRMTSTMRWLTLVPSVPGALWGGWLGTHLGLRATLAFSGSTALLLGLVAWQVPVIRRTRTLPTIAEEAITPYSA
jgi:MFS family permease